MVIAAFTAGGVAIIARVWWLFLACAVIVVLSVPAGKLIGIMEDTVLVESGPRAMAPAVGPGSAANPGVRLG